MSLGVITHAQNVILCRVANGIFKLVVKQTLAYLSSYGLFTRACASVERFPRKPPCHFLDSTYFINYIITL